MTSLKINRINKTRYQVKDDDKVVRECSSFKEAINAIISEDMILLNNLDEFYDTELDDMDMLESYSVAV